MNLGHPLEHITVTPATLPIPGPLPTLAPPAPSTAPAAPTPAPTTAEPVEVPA